MAAAFVLSTLSSAPVSAQEAESRAPGLVAAEAITTVLSQPAAALKMSQAAQSVGMPNATELLVELVEELAGDAATEKDTA